MKLKALILTCFLLIACSGRPVEKGKPADEHSQHQHLHIDQHLAEKWGIKTEKPRKVKVKLRVELTGKVCENLNSTHYISSLLPGVIHSVEVDLGQQVRKGQVLATIDSLDFTALKSSFVKAYQRMLLSKADYERARILYKKKALEKRELQKRETKWKEDAADFLSYWSKLLAVGIRASLLEEVKAMVREGNMEGLRSFLASTLQITAPASGKVIERKAVAGMKVEAHQTLFVLSDTSRLWVLLDAKEKDLPYLKPGAKVEIISDALEGRTFNGTIQVIGEKVDPSLRTVKVRATVENPEGFLKPEMFVKAYLERQEAEEMFSLPPEAVVEVFGTAGVFVKEGDGFAFRPVKVREGSGVVYVLGIKEGEEVVVKGAFYLKAQQEMKMSGGGGHHHAH